MTDKNNPALVSIKSFMGDFLVWRKTKSDVLKSLPKTVKGRLPRFRHKTYREAEIEARRLAREYPESAFVILQEIASAKVKDFPSTEKTESTEDINNESHP